MYNVNEEWLLEGEGEMFENGMPGPGESPDTSYRTRVEDIVNLPSRFIDKGANAFVVHDNAMEPGIVEGDVAIWRSVDPADLRSGDIVVLKPARGHFTVRRFLVHSGRKLYVADNKDYEPAECEKAELKLCGKLLEIFGRKNLS